MKRFSSILLAIAGVAALASPALAADQGVTLGSGSAALTELQSEGAIQSEDWASARALSGKAYREQPTLRNEFNLATSYVRTGQPALAIPLYADVAKYGEFSDGQTLYDYHSSSRPSRVRFNYADEANRRLDMLTGGPVADAGK